MVLARLGTDRIRLRGTPGLRFWRLLGTGRGDDTAPSSDLARSALFAVWDDEQHLDTFLDTDPVAARWRRAEESWQVRLRGIGGHGTWRGVDVLDRLVPGTAEGRVAIVTHADIRPRSWREFSRASRVVNDEVRAADGLLAVVGIGEAPILRLGTFSLWESLDSVRAFATRQPEHRTVIRRTRSDGWYGEELFARFEPFGSSGVWDGRDPLADVSGHNG